MRYTVRFANAKYIALVARFVQEESYEVPEGVYRGLDVVVEATDPQDAIDRAVEQLGWPDFEIGFAPFSVVASLESRAMLDSIRGVRAVMDFWKKAGFIKERDGLEHAMGLQASGRVRQTPIELLGPG